MKLLERKWLRQGWDILRFHWDKIVIGFLTLCMLFGGVWYVCRRMTPGELAVRQRIVAAAQSYLGCKEDDGSHRQIIDLYNSYEPRARDYEVTYQDSWCAAFSSAVAIAAGLEGWIPLECSCEQQILLFDAWGEWMEADWYLPQPGDYIFYDWDNTSRRDSRGWSDHVGIVVETFGPVIKVIEGNKDDQVAYRYVFLDDPWIRGFGTPDYRKYAENS